MRPLRGTFPEWNKEQKNSRDKNFGTERGTSFGITKAFDGRSFEMTLFENRGDRTG